MKRCGAGDKLNGRGQRVVFACDDDEGVLFATETRSQIDWGAPAGMHFASVEQHAIGAMKGRGHYSHTTRRHFDPIPAHGSLGRLFSSSVWERVVSAPNVSRGHGGE